MSIVLAIDIGTSSAKALAVDQKGQQVFNCHESYPTNYPEPGYAEQDPAIILHAVKKVIRISSERIKEKISTIAFSSAMHSILAVAADGSALTPLIIWSDLRSKKESQELNENSQAIDFAIHTGTPIHPMSPLCKLIWLRKNLPDIFESTHKFIGIKEYIWFNLFGVFEVDHGIASATGLFETTKLDWYKPSLVSTGILNERLSTPVSVCHQRELTNPTLLSEFGFKEPVRFVIGSSDGCLANLGSFAMDPQTLSLTIGTSGAIRRAMRQASNRHQKIFWYHLDEETLIEGGASNNGAVLLEWFSKNFLNEKIDSDVFIERAVKIPAGAEGLIFLPYVNGERAPLYDPDASGIFFGIKQHHTIEHFMRALLEGIGFALFSIAELMEGTGGTYTKLVASGGFTQSNEWVQIIANIFGKPVNVNNIENASALGAAMIGFKAIGETYEFSEEPMKVFEPDLSAHGLYKMQFKRFRKIMKLTEQLS